MPSRSSARRRRARDRSSAAGGARPGRSGPRSAPTVAAPAAHKPASRPDRILARTERSRVTVTVSCWGGSSRTARHGGGASRVRRVDVRALRTLCKYASTRCLSGGPGAPARVDRRLAECRGMRGEGAPAWLAGQPAEGGVVRAVRSFEDLAGRTNGPDRNADPAPSCREQTCVRTGRGPGRPRREAGETAPCPAGGAR
jgi:hypothetical protein